MAFTIEGAAKMEEINAADRIKLAICGPPGSGKSWLAVSGANDAEQAFDFDFDGRVASIAGKKNVSAKTYVDVNYPMMMPTAWVNFQNDVMQMELAAERKELPYKWFIPDSMTNMCTAAMNHVLYNDRSMRRELKVGNSVTYIAKSYDAYKAEQAEVIGMIQRLFCLGHVVACFHTAPEKAPGSTSEKPMFTGLLTVDPPRLIDMLSIFNEQWLCKATGPNAYSVVTKPAWDWLGKTALKIEAEEQNATLRDLIAKHRSK